MANLGGSCEKLTVKQTQVSEQLGILDEAIEMLSQSVDRMNNRVADVLKQEPPCGTVSNEPESIVPLAQRIRGASSRIKNIAESINSISDRCEL
jgi:predicted RNase H-like nuclease (RuvC/YqgF family)